MSRELNHVPADYPVLLADVKQRIRLARARAIMAVNAELNALYWDFLARNRDKLGDNMRLAMPYRNWDRMNEAGKASLRRAAADFLDSLDESETAG